MSATTGELVINITDPVENKDGMNRYITYKVNTETTLEEFEFKSFSVLKRYSDFAWLREALLHQLPGVIVPPLPPKVVMNLAPEFIEVRRRGLERFMTRCAEHPHIRVDKNFRMFLHADDKSYMKAKSDMAAAKKAAGGGGWLGAATSAMTGGGATAAANTTPEDQKILEILAYVKNLEAQMTNIAKHTEHLVKAGNDLAMGLFDFGLAFSMLGQHETDALNDALSQMGHTADQLSLIAADQVAKEKRWFEEPIVDYIAMLGAVREAIDRRQTVRKQSVAAAADHESKKASLAKLNITAVSAEKNAAKIPAAEAAVEAAEKAEAAAKEILETVTARTLEEVERFKRAKADDMRKVVLDYVQLQIEYNKQMEQQWASLVPEIEAIQVDKVPKRSIFDSTAAGAGTAGSQNSRMKGDELNSANDAALAAAAAAAATAPPLAPEGAAMTGSEPEAKPAPVSDASGGTAAQETTAMENDSATNVTISPAGDEVGKADTGVQEDVLEADEAAV